MKEKKHIVRYPTTINKMFTDIEKVLSPMKIENGGPLINLIKKANLPKGTKFGFYKTTIGLIFHILLPSGEIFCGAAIKDKRDEDDVLMALVRAAGRAVAVYNASHHSHTGGFIKLNSERDLSTRDRAIVVKTIIHELENNGHLKRVIKSI